MWPSTGPESSGWTRLSERTSLSVSSHTGGRIFPPESTIFLSIFFFHALMSTCNPKCKFCGSIDIKPAQGTNPNIATRSSTQTLSLPSKFAVAHPQRALGEKWSGRKGHTKMDILWDCPVKSAWLMRPHMREMSREGEEANRALTIILELLQTKRPQGAKAESQNEIDWAASRKLTTALEGWLQDNHHCQSCFANGALWVHYERIIAILVDEELRSV